MPPFRLLQCLDYRTLLLVQCGLLGLLNIASNGTVAAFLLCLIVLRPLPYLPALMRRPKTVLCYTPYFGSDMCSAFERAQTSQCPELDSLCRYTSDRRQADQASALLFHWRDVVEDAVQVPRQPHQKFIFFLLESPTNTFTSRPFGDYNDDFFNWTMTYRQDSDFPNPYLRLERRSAGEAEGQGWSTAAPGHNKTGQVAWFVSSCFTQSNRELVAQYLQNEGGLSVDVYGACGPLSCSGHGLGECDALAQNYYFYLALENSVCLDYVTEKLTRALRFGSVPIVLHRAIAERVAPADSFIAVDDFGSLADLAAHLKRVIDDDQLYAQYFRWRGRYVLRSFYESVVSDAVCDLCARLQADQQQHSVVHDMQKWWVDEAACQQDFVHNLYRKKTRPKLPLSPGYMP